MKRRLLHEDSIELLAIEDERRRERGHFAHELGTSARFDDAGHEATRGLAAALDRRVMHADVRRGVREERACFARLFVSARREQRELVPPQIVDGLSLRVAHEERGGAALLCVSLHCLDEVSGNHEVGYSKGEVFMERVTEPELMDEEAQAQAYSEADFEAPHERFVDLFLASWPGGLVQGPVLDLGCGPADVTVRLAKRCPDATVHGVDGSAAMLAFGTARVAKEGLGERVVLHQALLPRDEPPLPKYPVIVSNSLLHHLHDPSGMWAVVKKHAAAEAHVFVMDLMRPGTPEDVDTLVATYSRGEPDVLVRDFHASLCAAFTPDEVRAQLDAAGLQKLKIDVVSDRHFTVSGTVSSE